MNLTVEINTTAQTVSLSLPVDNERQACELLAILRELPGLTVLEDCFSETGPKGAELLVEARLACQTGILGALLAYRLPVPV